MFVRFLGGGIGHKATRLLVRIQDSLSSIVSTNTDDTDVADHLSGELCEAEDEDSIPEQPATGHAIEAEITAENIDLIEDCDNNKELEELYDEREDYGYDAAEDSEDEEDVTEGLEPDRAQKTTPTDGDKHTSLDDKGQIISADADDDEEWYGPEDGEDGICIDVDLEPSL